MNNKLVLSFSGGMDSSVLLHMAINRGYHEIHTISFNYGQRHKRELECIDKQFEDVEVIHSDIILTNNTIDAKFLKQIAPVSSLTNENINNPDIKDMAGEAQPISYVPFRNQLFNTIACSYAESIGVKTVWYGAAQVDSLAGYWDGSVQFIEKFNELTALNREHKVTLEAPLLTMSKADIIKKGIKLGVNFSNTWTCYSNHKNGLADATTPSSSLRIKGFIEAGYIDPIRYLQQQQLDKIYKEKKCKQL